MAGNVSIQLTRAGNRIFKANIGLLPDCHWRSDLKDYPTELLCHIRKSLVKKVPKLAEKYNPTTPSMRYFGYRIKENKDRGDTSRRAYTEDKAYIYVRPDSLEIDLKIEARHANRVRKDGFEVRPKTNYQAKAGWLTGWYVPHSTKKVNTVIKWLYKALKES